MRMLLREKEEDDDDERDHEENGNDDEEILRSCVLRNWRNKGNYGPITYYLC